jgi:carotenoid 1,2-hydratase
VPPGGYAWWYLDALSDDGRHGLTVIAFVGSVFSPWYASARRRGVADPDDHVSLNVALYGGSTGRWAMTERGRRSLARSADRLRIGPSAIARGDGRIVIDVDEWSVPIPRRMRGTITVDTGPVFAVDHALDGVGRHLWRPIAPLARVKVAFSSPAVSWEGSAYVDSNRGVEPLEAGFRSWTWSRSTLSGRTTIFYDVERIDGSRNGVAIAMDPDGRTSPRSAPPVAALPGTLWRVARSVRSEAEPQAIRTLEDTPFYTRTATRTVLDGQSCDTVCESVDLRRFSARWVQTLLPFRMPRIR